MDYISSYGTELTISDSGEASYAEKSVGLTDGTDAGREAVKMVWSPERTASAKRPTRT